MKILDAQPSDVGYLKYQWPVYFKPFQKSFLRKCKKTLKDKVSKRFLFSAKMEKKYFKSFKKTGKTTLKRTIQLKVVIQIFGVFVKKGKNRKSLIFIYPHVKLSFVAIFTRTLSFVSIFIYPHVKLSFVAIFIYPHVKFRLNIYLPAR